MRTPWKSQLAIAALGALLALSLGACEAAPTGLAQPTSISVDGPRLEPESDEARDTRNAAGIPTRITGQGKLVESRRLERF